MHKYDKLTANLIFKQIISGIYIFFIDNNISIICTDTGSKKKDIHKTPEVVFIDLTLCHVFHCDPFFSFSFFFF